MAVRTPVLARSVSDRERRARLGVRHALSEASRVRTPEDAATAMVFLHATDSPSVHLVPADWGQRWTRRLGA